MIVTISDGLADKKASISLNVSMAGSYPFEKVKKKKETLSCPSSSLTPIQFKYRGEKLIILTNAV